MIYFRKNKAVDEIQYCFNLSAESQINNMSQLLDLV
jgi:hypothetical protein